MISEIPVAEETQEVVQETPVETVAEKDETISATNAETAEKRKPGRPTKGKVEKVGKVEKAKPPPKPKAKPRSPKEKIAPANPQPEITENRAPESCYGLSSAQLVSELVNRRRLEERQMKPNLYRSFVM